MRPTHKISHNKIKLYSKLIFANSIFDTIIKKISQAKMFILQTRHRVYSHLWSFHTYINTFMNFLYCRLGSSNNIVLSNCSVVLTVICLAIFRESLVFFYFKLRFVIYFNYFIDILLILWCFFCTFTTINLLKAWCDETYK